MALLGHSCYGWRRHADSWKKEKECAFNVHLEEYQQHLGLPGRCVCRLCRLQSRVLGRDGRLVGNVSAGIVAARYWNLLHRYHSEGRVAEAVRLDRCHDGSGLPA